MYATTRFATHYLSYLIILINTWVIVRLEVENKLGVESVDVPVSLLVADSRLARAVLSGHEAGQAGLVILAQVEADTLRLYSQILRTGATEIRAGDR